VGTGQWQWKLASDSGNQPVTVETGQWQWELASDK